MGFSGGGGGQIEPPSPEYPGFQLRSRDSVKMTLKLSFKISNFQWLVQEAKFWCTTTIAQTEIWSRRSTEYCQQRERKVRL